MLWRHWSGFRTMRARMLSWLLLLNMLPVLLLVVIGLGYAERQLQQDLAGETQRSGILLARAFDQTIEQKLETARTLVRSPYIHEALIGFTRAFAQAEKYSMAYQALEDRYWPYLAYFAEQQGLRDLLLISPGGDVVFSAAQSDWYGSNIYAENGSGQPLQRIFRQAMVQADGVIILNTHSDAQTAYIAAPVFQSTLTGVVVFIPDSDIFLQQFQRDSGGGQLINVYLPDKDGRFLRWPDQELTDRGTQLNRILATAYLGAPLQGELELQDFNGLYSALSLPSVDGVLMVQQDTDAALAAIYELRISASLGAGILIIILVLAARSVSNSVTLPVKELAEKLQKIGQGQRQLTADESRRDEIGALAREFNRMTKSLRKTQAQLVQSEKMASIGHLAAGVAHEINNPLSVVQANLDVLKEYLGTYTGLAELLLQYYQSDPPPDESRRQQLQEQILTILSQNDLAYVHEDTDAILQDTRQGLERVRNIISSLQIFSELGNDSLQNIDLKSFLEHILAQLTVQDKHKVQVHYDIRLTGPVRIRPEEMRKVFMAVLDNAFRACLPEGEITIRAAQQNGMVQIEFCDTGAGMDAALLKRIFDPFYTTRAVGEGMGLGLAVAHAIVEAHGGSIRAESKPGSGTCIRIRIPS